MKKKVVHVINNCSYGGAEMMLYKVLMKTDKNKWDLSVIFLNDKGDLKEEFISLGIPIYFLGIEKNISTILGLWKLVKTIDNIQPDLIMTWMYHSSLLIQGITLLLFKKFPVVWNIRHSIYSLDHEKKTTKLIIKLLALLSKFPTKIIYNSQIASQQHYKLGYSSQKSFLIPNGFIVDTFIPSSLAYQQLRQELNIPSDAIIIGRIARYHPMKDYSNLLNGAVKLLKNNPQLHFVLVGPNIDNDNAELTQEIQELGINNNIHLLGIRADTPMLNAGFDIACTTSAWGEGFPNVLGEAMCCEVPCVVTDVGDSAWVVGDTGLVVPPRDSQALAEAWKKLIEDGKLRKNLGIKARQRIINNFAINKIVSNYEHLYEQILN